MSDDALVDGVRDWLLRNGYVLEMEVARSVARHATWTHQGLNYVDPIQGKTREVDVMGTWAESPRRGQTLHSVSVVIECKSTSAPWVLFTGENEPTGNLPLSYSESACAVCGVLVETVGQLISKWGPHCYAIAEKRDTNKGIDHAYESVQQALSATLGSLNAGPDALGHDELIISTIGIPVVVTKSPLVTCSLASGRDVKLQVTDRASIEVTSTASGAPESYPVLVVNEGAVGDLLTAVDAAAVFDSGALPPRFLQTLHLLADRAGGNPPKQTNSSDD